MAATAISEPKMALLSDRGVVAVTGEDAGKLLHGLVTNDMALLGVSPAIHAGLLTPQGKILFDFFVVKTGRGYLLETAREKAGDLVKRLALYKLRAKVEIDDVSSQFTVAVLWGGADLAGKTTPPAAAFADPRLPALGWRELIPLSRSPVAGDAATIAATEQHYHAHRIALGVPEGGKDYAFGDTFPHEALFDQLNGVSFTKGCYVGQEVVSRMEHRGTMRKRVVPVVAGAPLPPPGTEIKAGDVTIGTLGSVAGSRGLALMRLDRAAEFAANGIPMRAGSILMEIQLASWARFAVSPALD
jgi:hypothetical protein